MIAQMIKVIIIIRLSIVLNISALKILTMWIYFNLRLFHLSFDLEVQCPYPFQCGMGENCIVGNQ